MIYMEIKRDHITKDYKKEEVIFLCRHFLNNRPCDFHKKRGVPCNSSCPYQDRIDKRILLIKLGAPGDALRTTCLLPSLKKEYPSCQITWMTSESSRLLLENNSLIDRLVSHTDEMFAILQTEHFDIAINPDSDPYAARLLKMSKTDKKLGFTWSDKGHVLCCNPEAEEWLRMGLFDDMKKSNKASYQTHLHRLCQLGLINPKPILNITDRERVWAMNFFKELGIDQKRPVIGINTGAGNRWPLKSWTLESQIHFIQLAKRKHPEWQLLLLGGPGEIKKNKIIEERCRGMVINTGQHQIRDFSALIQQVNVLLTSDTVALHIGLALDRGIVALFGPTSHGEVDLGGAGEKLFSELDCLVCYQNKCDKSPSCMDLITPERVFVSIESCLKGIALAF